MSGDHSASNQKLEYPFVITPVDPEISDELSRDFAGIQDGYVLIGPKMYCYTGGYRDYAGQLYNFQAKPDDIWVVTFPRSGTTLVQELVWLIENNFDYERAQKQLLTERFLFLESFIREGTDADIDKWQSKSQRFFKTHFSFSLMPPSVMNVKAKTIYVARHPKDVVVSLYHVNKLWTFMDYTNDFAKFWDYFERDLIVRAPYFEHIKEGWAHRDEPNVLFLFYDELINDLPATIKKIAAFLAKDINDDQLSKLLEHLKFENFRRNPAVNNQNAADNGHMNTKESSFVRRGKVSGREWQPEYTPEIIARVEKWLEKNLRDTTLRFPEY